MKKFRCHFVPAVQPWRLMPSAMQISRAAIGRFTSLRYMWLFISSRSCFASKSSTTLGIAGGAPILASTACTPLTTRKSLFFSTP